MKMRICLAVMAALIIATCFGCGNPFAPEDNDLVIINQRNESVLVNIEGEYATMFEVGPRSTDTVNIVGEGSYSVTIFTKNGASWHTTATGQYQVTIIIPSSGQPYKR